MNSPCGFSGKMQQERSQQGPTYNGLALEIYPPTYSSKSSSSYGLQGHNPPRNEPSGCNGKAFQFPGHKHRRCNFAKIQSKCGCCHTRLPSQKWNPTKNESKFLDFKLHAKCNSIVKSVSKLETRNGIKLQLLAVLMQMQLERRS